MTHLFHNWFSGTSLVRASPYPGVSVPERGEKMEFSRLGPTVADCDFNENITRTSLGILSKYIPVFPLVKNTRVFKLKFQLIETTTTVFFHQFCIGVLALWVFVESLHVRVRGGGVEIVVALLGVLAVIPLGACETKDPLLEDGVFLVPEGDRETQPALAITDAHESIFAPAIGSRASMIVCEIIPAVQGRGRKLVIASKSVSKHN